MSTLPIIDHEAIETLRSLSPDDDSFLRELIGVFLSDTPERIAELRRGLETGDAPLFTRAAHSIKGSSSNLGASRLRAVAERLEHDARTAGLGALGERLGELEAEFDAARAELEQLS
jgi:histidine phosphotransfer protein HptB